MNDSNISVSRLARAEAARRETRRFFKFLVVGGVGFVIDTGCLSLLVFAFSFDRVLAKGIAFSIAVVNNFLWNRFWTYPESRSRPALAQVALFVLVSLVGLAINLLVFGRADRLARPFVSPAVALYFAQATAVGVALFWNYAANRLVTYRHVGLGR